MRGIRKQMLLPYIVFLAILLVTDGPSHAAETFFMALPPTPVFTYRVTSTNQLVKPGPIPLRFSRTEDGLFCSKVNQVGVDIGSSGYTPGGPPPGTSDPNAVIYTSAISNGASLCNFGYNDTMVPLAVSPWTDELMTRDAQGGCMKDPLPPWPDPGDTGRWTQTLRRQAGNWRTTWEYFKPFLRKSGGQYEWKAVTSSNSNVICDTQVPFICKAKVVLTCDPVAGPNRPPVFESVSLASESVPVEGGKIPITVTAYDDVGVYEVRGYVNPIDKNTYYTYDSSFELHRTGGLGRTAGGDNRSKWEGTIEIPRNPTSLARMNTVLLELSDLEGGKNLRTVVPASSTKPIQQAGPPDLIPPQILSFSATPLTFPATGGAVTVNLRASDNIGVGSVQLTLVYPNGQAAPMQMPLVGGTAANGEWRTGWNMWANTETTQKVYTVKATVKDANNTVSSQLLQLAVAGKPVPTLQQPATGTMLPGTTTPKTVAPSTLPTIR